MSIEEQQGYTRAMNEVATYARSMVETDPDPLTWLDVALYAQTSIMDVEDALELDLGEQNG